MIYRFCAPTMGDLEGGGGRVEIQDPCPGPAQRAELSDGKGDATAACDGFFSAADERSSRSFGPLLVLKADCAATAAHRVRFAPAL